MTADEHTTFKGEDISPEKDGGVLKEIIKEGSGDERPLPNDKVSVHYVGTLLDGTKFDSSRDRNDRFSFDLGKGSVIKAWDIGVATMKRGEICRLICKPEYAYGENGSGEKIGPNTTLIFEIELFDFTGEDLSEGKDQSIIRRTLKKGESWSKPNDGASVEVLLKGTYENKVFDERTVSFTLGEGFLQNIPEGVEQALTKMTKQEHAQLKLKSKATTGVEKFNIPANTPVEYEVTLINFEKAKETWSMSDAEKLEQSDVLKKRAGELFKDGHYRAAMKKYNLIADYLQTPTYTDENDKKKAEELKLSAQSNIALCHLKLNDHAECIRACEKALEIDPKNEKCLFRRGQSQLSMSNYDEAVKDFQEVLKLNPSNSAAKQLIQTCREQIKAYQQKEKQLYLNIFSKMAKQNEKL
jgi:FK506-binding protein 4/5